MMIKQTLSWDDVRGRLERFDIEGERIYGVPRGGMIVASLLTRATRVLDPSEATMILDDIIDSGATRDRFVKRYPDVPFVAIADKMNGDTGWFVFPWEDGEEDSIVDSVTRLLQFIGEDPKRDGLLNTPGRVVRALREMTRGYGEDPAKILSTTFEVPHDEMILLRGIRFHSLCEHHMLPFVGRVTVGYLPGPRVVGLSKLARLVHCFARRLQIQERMTQEIAEAVMEHIEARGVGVIVEAHHACMGCRGVEQPDAEMVTSSMLGKMRDNFAVRAEFLELSK